MRPVVYPRDLKLPPNPDFGSGFAWRRIELVNEPGRTTGHLADTFHEMRCEVAHVEGRVRAISGTMIRYPTTLCPGASEPLQALVGRSIHEAPLSLYRFGALAGHCTHLLDLSYHVISHATRSEPVARYEATVPDEVSDPVPCEVRRDGELLLRWTVRRGVVLQPANLQGLPLAAGFLRAAVRQLHPEQLGAALLLARTYFISNGRRYDMRKVAGLPTSENLALKNRCFAYSESHGDRGRFRGESQLDLKSPQSLFQDGEK